MLEDLVEDDEALFGAAHLVVNITSESLAECVGREISDAQVVPFLELAELAVDVLLCDGVWFVVNGVPLGVVALEDEGVRVGAALQLVEFLHALVYGFVECEATGLAGLLLDDGALCGEHVLPFQLEHVGDTASGAEAEACIGFP